MTAYIGEDDLEHLKNILYINFSQIDVKKKCTDIIPIEKDSNQAKIEMFVASKKATNRKNSTIKQYVREVNNLICFTGKNIEDITGMDVKLYYACMREHRKIKASTMETRIHYLSSFWDFLTIEELVEKNPIKKVEIIKTESKIKKPFSAEDLEALRDGCKNIRDRALIEFLYSTGVRVSELVRLNIGDLDLRHKKVIVYGKNSKERVTYLTETALFHLKRYLKKRATDSGKSYDEMANQPLFTSLRSSFIRFSIAGIQFMLRSLSKLTGVKNVHPHRFRRTIATDLLNRGMPLEQVKQLLGHEKIDTTMLYCFVDELNVEMSHRKYA